jgi:hypothetical protein
VTPIVSKWETTWRWRQLPTKSPCEKVLAKFDAEFAPMAHAVENGEFALRVGSEMSRSSAINEELLI